MKALMLSIVSIVLLGVGCKDVGKSSETSILQKKIVCEEKGREYVERSGWKTARSYEFVYSKRLDTCLVFIDNSNSYVINEGESYIIYDILESKKEIYSADEGTTIYGDKLECNREEKSCISMKEFKKIKEELWNEK